MVPVRFFLQTFGCQMNDHDSGVLARALEERGYRQVAEATEADVILLNTCAIRDKAEQKVYSQLGRYRGLKTSRPELVLAVGGCMAQSEGRRVLSRAPYVDLVFGTQTLAEVPDLVEKVLRERRRLVATSLDGGGASLRAFYSHSRGGAPRAYVTVMQGCDNFCAYCIVPHVRGPEFSRPAAEIVDEVERLTADGVREVTLLGQNVNSYGQKSPGETDFAGVIELLARIEGLRRIRFTTSHPKDLSERLIGLFAQEPKLMPHIHLPLQSGSDRILEAMNRRYRFADYEALVRRLRQARPGIAITSDMIVGFPGESEADFQETLAALDRIGFDGLFSFKFSPRRGTVAAGLPDPVPEDVKEHRLARLQQLQESHTLAANRSCIGSSTVVLVEGPSRAAGGQLTGRTPENRIANFAGDPGWSGLEASVRVLDASLHSLCAEAAVVPGRAA